MGQKETGGHPEYHQIPLEGLRLAAHKPTSLSTEVDIKQGSEEASGGMPTIYTSPGREDSGNLKAINLTFVIQLASDVREKKKQTMDGFVGKNLSELLEIAPKVFDNRDNKEDSLVKMNRATVAALQAPGTSGPE